MVVRFGPSFHFGDGIDLCFQDDQGHPGQFEVLGQPGMVDMVVSGQAVADLLQRYVHAFQLGAQRAHGPRPAKIDH